jgi:diguanylate cyclase (GGDEF)-like protein
MTINISELEQRLNEARTPLEEIEAGNELAWELRHAQPARAFELCQKVIGLCAAGQFNLHSFQSGRAASLTTLGFLNHQAGKLDLALSQCFEAVSLLEHLPPSRVTVDALRLIGWIYYFLGEQPSALAYGLKALKIAQESGMRLQEASAQDGLAMIYGASGDQKQARERHSLALQIARELGETELEAFILNNQAENLHDMGSLEESLEPALNSFEIARRIQHKALEISVMETIGQIYLKLGRLEQAERILRQGLEMAGQQKQPMDEIAFWLRLGKLYASQGKLDLAEENMRQGLENAQVTGAKALQAECQSALAEIYEQKGRPSEALQAFKRFYTLQKEVSGEAAARQLAVLRVAHEVETARRDAEIYRLRNVELQHEIDERSRVEAELERLATVDALTNVFNRRHFFERTQREFDRSVRYHHPLAILMIDIDHFKSINDSYGHATGDHILLLLSAFIHQSLREVDLVGRYSGEEFIAALPETSMDQAKLVAERVRQRVERHRFDIPAGSLALTVSIGVACIQDSEDILRDELDRLIDRADRACQHAKLSGRNKVA